MFAQIILNRLHNFIKKYKLLNNNQLGSTQGKEAGEPGLNLEWFFLPSMCDRWQFCSYYCYKKKLMSKFNKKMDLFYNRKDGK